MAAKRVVLHWTEAFFKALSQSSICLDCVSWMKYGFNLNRWLTVSSMCPCYDHIIEKSTAHQRILSPAIFDFSSYPGPNWYVYLFYKVMYMVPPPFPLRISTVGKIKVNISAGLAVDDCISFFLDEYPNTWHPDEANLFWEMHILSAEGYDLCDDVNCEPCCDCCL